MKIPSEHLVLGVFGTIGAAAYASMRGGSSKKEEKTPASVPLNAENAYVITYVLTSDSEEEAFIKQFLAEAMKEENNLLSTSARHASRNRVETHETNYEQKNKKRC